MKEITLIVKPTHSCNLDCSYCYDKAKREAFGPEKMTLETVAQIAAVFKNDAKQWIWHGGEPLLMGIDFFHQANDLILTIIPDIKISIQTNGTLIDQTTIDFFKKYDIRPGLSFDGINNNLTRKNTVRLMEVFALLEKNKIPGGAIMLITPDNVGNLIGEYEFAKRLRIEMQVNPIFTANGNRENTTNLDGQLMGAEICKFFDYWIADTDNPTGSQLCERYIHSLLNTGSGMCCETDCTGKWFSINPDGSIMPCGRDWEDDMYFGNIKAVKDVQEIREHPNFVRFNARTKELLAGCVNHCPFFYACNCGCYGNSYTHDKSLATPEPNQCKATRIILTHLYNTIKSIDLNYQGDKFNPFFKKMLMKVGFRNLDFIERTVKENLTNTVDLYPPNGSQE